MTLFSEKYLPIRILIILLSFVYLSCTETNSNIRSITSGDIKAYLKQTPNAEEHPNAGVIMLFDYGYIEYFKDGSSVFKSVARLKILNERGRERATITIPYREGYGEVKIIFANTITPCGKVVPLDTKDIHDTSKYSGYEYYSDLKEKRFTMPAVEDGCIVEYAYEVKNTKPLLTFDLYVNFYLQGYYPVEEEILEIVLPAHIELNYKKYLTTLAPQITQEGNKKKYIFTIRKQREIIEEPRMPSLSDKSTFPQVAVWTMKNWEDVSRWYTKLVQEQMISSPELVKFTQQLIANKKTDEEKINAIFGFVSQKVSYIAVLQGPHTHKPHAASETFNKRYGDCKDKTILLLTMLKIAGIKGLPVLVPSDDEYFDETIPSVNAFDHVIAVVPLGDKYFWLDATNEVAAYNSPPFLSPTSVFVINTDGSYRFMKTPTLDDKKDFCKSDTKYTINQEGDAYIDWLFSCSGKAAEDFRYSFKYMSPEKRRQLFEEERNIEVEKLDFGSFTDTQESFVIKVKGTIKNLAQKLDDEIMVLSGITRLDSLRDITVAKDRRYPVVFGDSYYFQRNKSYIFPAGFKIKRLPQAFTVNNPFQYRSEKYVFHGSTFEVSEAKKEKKHKVNLDNLEDLKKYAVEIQKHESAWKNIIIEKK